MDGTGYTLRFEAIRLDENVSTLTEQLGHFDNASDNYIEWPKPTPFDTIEMPRFPVESLPGPLAAFVEALAETTQTPVEMAGILSLGVLSTAFQSRYHLEVTPDWTEPLCLYTLAVAAPGERKSSVIKALIAPACEYEDMRFSNLANETEEKHPYRLFADDTTPEKLVDIMDAQGGCITLASAEGGVFDSLLGRYDKGPNLDIYLKGHAGDAISVDRVNRKSNKVSNPRLTMLLTVQPDVLARFVGNKTFRDRGLCGRFLYVICRSMVGYRNVTPDPIQLSTKSEYQKFVHRILSDDEIGIIRLSVDADKERESYAEVIEKRLIDEWEHMRDWGGKHVGAMLRIAALIHAAEVQGSPIETPISVDVLTEAIKIAECLGAHAMAAYELGGASETYADAKYLWKRIQRSGQGDITRRDLHQMCRGKFQKIEHIEAPLQTLVEMGYIREIDIGNGSRGRPSRKIIINPYAQNSQKPQKHEY